MGNRLGHHLGHQTSHRRPLLSALEADARTGIHPAVDLAFGQPSLPRGRPTAPALAANLPRPAKPFSTCDLCDANPDRLATGSLAVLPPVFTRYGKRPAFSGKASTLKVFEDNKLVRATLESPGNGQVLVIDGSGSTRTALVGGNLGVLAVQNDWAGLVVHGAIRDVDELNACDIGIRALALQPQRSARKGVGDKDVRVMIAGVAVEPGDAIYVDADGALVSKEKLD